jgi:hypothetical protein
MPQGTLGPAVYETKKSPYTYQQEQYQPQTKAEEKQIVAAAKDAVPKSEDTDGWSKNDWLQFGLAMMAGQSPHALSNIGAAGLSVLSARKEREKEERAIASKMMDKTDMTKVVDRLMKDDPSLSYRDAYEIFQAGKTNAELIARGLTAKEQDSATTRAAKLTAAKAKLDEQYPSFLRNTSTPDGKKRAAEYAAKLAEIEKEFPPLPGGVVAPAATAALPLKVLNKQPSN